MIRRLSAGLGLPADLLIAGYECEKWLDVSQGNMCHSTESGMANA